MKKFVSGIGEVEMTSEEIAAFLAQQEADSNRPKPVPNAVSSAQAKVALYNAGLLDAVEAAVSTSYRPLQIYWASATSFERAHPYVMGIAAEISLSDEQMDSLFIAASAL